LRHQEEIKAYLDAREQRVEEVRQRIERHQEDLSDLRRRLRARHHGS
jgi:predicted  nucleic acid-binding Zn-ribbon protein